MDKGMKTCLQCGAVFQTDPYHPHSKYCSERCRRDAQNQRRRDERQGVTKPDISPDDEIKKRELAALEKRVRDDVGRTRILAELLDESVERINAADVKPCRPKHKAISDPETMVVLRSDWHPGLITPSYDLDVFHRRAELFTEKIIRIHDIISKTIPLERLVFIDLGDLLTGQNIFPNQAWKTQVSVMKQIYTETAPEIIAQNLTMLEYFPEVEQYSVPGNHGRTGKEAPDEVNFDTILAQDIARRFEFVDRMKVEVEWGKFMFVDVYDWRFLCTHGNLVKSWMNIPFYGLVNKGMRWQGSLPRNWNFLVHGHFHVPFNFPWNDFEIIGNGCFPSDDDFALEVLGMSSTPAQQVFGVHPEHGITWRYTLKLD